MREVVYFYSKHVEKASFGVCVCGCMCASFGLLGCFRMLCWVSEGGGLVKGSCLIGLLGGCVTSCAKGAGCIAQTGLFLFLSIYFKLQ